MARDATNQRVRKGSVTEEFEREGNRAKSGVRARVEHVFGVVKRLWGFDKARYPRPGQERHARVRSGGLAYIFLARKRLAA